MKKIFLFISPLIAFFLGGLLFPLYSNAEALPTLSNDTISLVLEGNNSLSYDTFSVFDTIPLNKEPTKYYNLFAAYQNDPLVTGARLNTMGANEYTVSKLTNSQIETVSSDVPYLYDVQGNIIQWEDVYFVTYQNGMFHGNLYVDSNGDILTEDISKTKTMFKLGLGGYLLNVTDIANIYDEISRELYSNEFNIALDGTDLSNTNLSYYIHGANVGRNSNISEWFIYVPNIYSQGVSVASFYNNLSALSDIYYNGDSVIYKNLRGNSFNISSGTSINGYSYERHIQQSWTITNQSSTNYTDYQNGVRGSYNLSNTIFQYDTSLFNNDNVVSFKKLSPLPSTKQLQYSDDYDYNYIKELEQSLNDLSISTNSQFDDSQQIDDSNYPLIIEIPLTTPDYTPSELPFPEVQTTPMPDPATAPSIGSDIGDIDPTELRSTIPIINNLLNRFPFSIPWDIYGLLSGLSVQRETPYINTTIHIPCINYDWVLDYDLSDFDDIASLFRTLFLITFILGLAYFSYDHFFGS